MLMQQRVFLMPFKLRIAGDFVERPKNKSLSSGTAEMWRKHVCVKLVCSSMQPAPNPFIFVLPSSTHKRRRPCHISLFFVILTSFCKIFPCRGVGFQQRTVVQLQKLVLRLFSIDSFDKLFLASWTTIASWTTTHWKPCIYCYGNKMPWFSWKELIQFDCIHELKMTWTEIQKKLCFLSLLIETFKIVRM